MYKSFLYPTLILLFLQLKVISQEEFLDFTIDYPDTPFLMQNSFTMVDELTDSFTVFLTKNSDISAYHFDSALQTKGRLLSRQLPNKYKFPLGGTIENTKYTLFYSNKDKSKFAGIVFDFNTRWSNTFEIDLKLKNEILLTQFNHSNKFHLLTASYREDLLYLYIFDNSGQYEKKIIDLSKYEFFGGAKHPARLKHALALGTTIGPFTDIKLVQNDIAYSLDSMISWYKLYLNEEKLYLVIDLNTDLTQIISYNLHTEDVDLIKIPQPSFKQEAKSNSYFLNGKLFQLKINTQEMVLQITDLATEKLIKEHHISKHDSLNISIGPVRQRGGRYENHREFDKTSKFLRKVTSGNPAILVDEFDGTYQVNIGSVKEINDSLLHAIAFTSPFSVVAVFGSVTFFVNPVALAFYKASDTKAVYIFSLLDENFELTYGEEPENIFYVIHDYIEREGIKRFTAADVFKYKGDYIFGRLDRKTKNYSLLKF